MQSETDRQIVRMLVRARCDFQDMRKRMDNRLSRKANGETQNRENMAENVMQTGDVEMFKAIADTAREQESNIEKELKAALKRFPIYTEFLSKVKGVGPVAAGWIIGEIDIHRADTVSKIWQFCGLNPGMVQGKKRVEKTEGKKTVVYLVPTGKMVRGDRLTEGHVAPFNKRLRTALCGVLADGFIKAQAPYALDYYYPRKERLAQSDNATFERQAGKPDKEVAWKDARPIHRDMAARRYMIKMFLRDLYVAWRTLEELPVRKPYEEEYLGKKHTQKIADGKDKSVSYERAAARKTTERRERVNPGKTTRDTERAEAGQSMAM